jgi:hypothetical protein
MIPLNVVSNLALKKFISIRKISEKSQCRGSLQIPVEGQPKKAVKITKIKESLRSHPTKRSLRSCDD